MDLLHVVLLVAAGIAGGIWPRSSAGPRSLPSPRCSPPDCRRSWRPRPTPSRYARPVPGRHYDRSQLPPFDRSFVAVALASIVGALIGAVLLLLTPERVFSALVPLLLGFATVLFAYAGRISTWLRARAATRGNAAPLHPFAGGGAAGLGLWRLFRRRRRRADARRAVGRDGGDYVPPTSPRTW